MSTRSHVTSMVICVLLTALGACRSEPRNAGAGATAVAASSGAVADTSQQAMAGETKRMHQDTLASRVEAHLQRLSTSNPDSLKALVPVDREVVTTLIADCEKMMREMKMTPPRKWQTAVKDLREDLTRLATLSGTQLQSAIPPHRKRIEDMLSMRRDMMKM